MELLDNALERIRPYITEALAIGNPPNRELSYRGPEDYNYFGSERNTATVARLRLDWELSKHSLAELTNEDTASIMLGQMENDLLELIEDGDVSNVTDPLLKVIDGSKKRGKQPINVDIFSAQLFWEHKEKKKVTEYTLYLLMAVQWEE